MEKMAMMRSLSSSIYLRSLGSSSSSSAAAVAFIDHQNLRDGLRIIHLSPPPPPPVFPQALPFRTDDKAGQETLANVFCAAEAAEEFGGMLVSLKMEIDDSPGSSGEVTLITWEEGLPEEFVNVLRAVYQRYTAYLDAFGPDETYLRKKVENELGTKMTHLKMRCSGIVSEWEKITILGTSGISGSFVEQRA